MRTDVCLVECSSDVTFSVPMTAGALCFPFPSETLRKDGYIELRIDGKRCLKHRLVAEQFIENPMNYPCVDHINHNRADNDKDNLRWVTHSMNNNNRYDQKRVKTIPSEAMLVEEFNGWTFEFLYFHEDTFYRYNGIDYVVLPKFKSLRAGYFTATTDVDGRLHSLYLNKFKREFGFI